MAFNTTTLSAAIVANQNSFQVASTTNITAPNFTTGVGITYLYVETELMLVTGVPASGFVTVLRGYAGTPTAAHAITTPVLIGLPADFGPIVPSQKAFQDWGPSGTIYGAAGPVASNGTITATGSIFHVTGTTAIATINPPTTSQGANFPGSIEGGRITIIFDGVAAWNNTGNIGANGTPTTAGSAVDFIFDQSTSKWYPTRLA